MKSIFLTDLAWLAALALFITGMGLIAWARLWEPSLWRDAALQWRAWRARRRRYAAVTRAEDCRDLGPFGRPASE